MQKENTDPVCKKIPLTTVSEKCKIEFFLSIEFENISTGAQVTSSSNQGAKKPLLNY